MSRFVSRASSAVQHYGDTFVLGTTKPDATNTGVTPGTTLTDVTSIYTASTAGATITGMRFLNYVTVTAANVTFRDCEFLGPVSTSFVNPYYGLVNCRNSGATNTLIERCTIHPQSATGPGFWWLVGVSVRSGATVTVRRCHIFHTVDGVNAGDAKGSVVTVEGNYIHDLAFFNNCNDQATSSPAYWTHNDCVQLSGDSGHVITGNNFQSYMAPIIGMSGCDRTLGGYNDTSGTTGSGVPSARNAWSCGVTISPDYGPVVVDIEYNWFDGGTANFQSNYLPTGVTTPYNGGTIANNRFGYGQYDYTGGTGTKDSYEIRYITGYSYTGLTTNYWDPDCANVPDAIKGTYFYNGFSGGIRVS